MPDAEFDNFAENYDEALQKGLSLVGEDKDYFASGRLAWLAGCLAGRLPDRPIVLDFGCGTGSATPHVFRHFPGAELVGVDVSERSIEVARKGFDSPGVSFELIRREGRSRDFDLAFCNGVFHHIPPPDRAEALAYVWRVLKPGGLFAFFENNPLHPGTRLIMSRCPFDRDAVTLTARQARAMLVVGGFDIQRTDFLFVFPRFLRALRRFERSLTHFPVGGQYMVLATKAGRGDPR